MCHPFLNEGRFGSRRLMASEPKKLKGDLPRAIFKRAFFGADFTITEGDGILKSAIYHRTGHAGWLGRKRYS
jgi:hypothetical protein